MTGDAATAAREPRTATREVVAERDTPAIEVEARVVIDGRDEGPIAVSMAAGTSVETGGTAEVESERQATRREVAGTAPEVRGIRVRAQAG